MSKIIFLISVVVLITGCGVSSDEHEKLKSDYSKLTNENKKLINELDECKNGESKIVARIEKAIKEEKYQNAITDINMLYERFPESQYNQKYQKQIKVLNRKIKDVAERLEKERLEKERLANLNNTGMWEIKYYVDNFGEPTKEAYIVNTSKIRGLFSNSATQNSKLDVEILVSIYYGVPQIYIYLYEYAGNNPVKVYSDTKYDVHIQDSEKNRFELEAANASNRLFFIGGGNYVVYNALVKGGTVKFKINERNRSLTEYSFKIKDAKYFNNAYRMLNEKIKK